jgi:site-specific DNA-methyltransferase (adenine-specific)
MTPRVEHLAEGVEVWLGDCAEVLGSLREVDHVITDPPYETEAHTLQRRARRGAGVNVEPLSFEPITAALREQVAQEITRVSNGWALLFCQAEAVAAWRDVLTAAGAIYKRSMVWIKPDGQPQYSGDRPGMGYESIVAAWCGEGRSRWNGGGRHGVFQCNKGEQERTGHQTQKPQRLMRDLVALFTNVGDVVLDPFMGSGSTGVAAVRLGRGFIGIEQDAGHFDTCCRRISVALAQPDIFIGRPPAAKQEALAL